MVLGLIVFAVALALDAPVWVALVAGAVVAGVLLATGPHRRRVRERRAAELIALRAERRDERRAARKESIRERTGLDVDLVMRATQDTVHAVGSKITSRLEARYERADQRERVARGDWLDLDADFEAMRARAGRAHHRR